MTWHSRVYGSVCIGLALAAAAATLQGQSPQQFRAGVEIVELDVTVLDRNRNPVRDLRAEDFAIYEDGKLRPVAAFTAVDVSRAAAAAVTDDERLAPSPTSEGRAVVILMDRSIPAGMPTKIARRVAAAAVNAMGPQDLGAVIYTGYPASEPLTADRTRLLERIGVNEAAAGLSPEQLEAWGIADERFAAELGRPMPGTELLNGECMCGLCVLETIQEIAESLRGVEKRSKSLLFIGSDLVLESAVTNCTGKVRDARARLFRAMDAVHLTVHAFDAMGLETGLVGANSNIRGRDLTNAIPARSQNRLARQGNLAVLPDRTGGRTILHSNEPDRAVPSIFGENAAYYLIAFQPAAKADGKPHAISVKVKRNDVKVSARRSYVRTG